MNDHYHKYLHPGPIEREWGVYVSAAGYTRTTVHENEARPKYDKREPFWNRARSRDNFHFVLIWKGKGLLDCGEGIPREVGAGACLLLRPGVSFRYESALRCDREEYWVGFNGYYIRRLMGDLFDTEDLVLRSDGSREILDLLLEIIEEARSKTIGYVQRAAGLLLQILALMYAAS